MITLGSGDVMNISGNAIATPLHELKAVGGAPTPIKPKRHFEVRAGATLRLSYLRLTGGTVMSTLTNQNIGYIGGSILAAGAGALVEIVSCVFSGCDAGQTCARHGGVLGVIGSAKAIVTSSVFENVYAYTAVLWSVLVVLRFSYEQFFQKCAA